VELTVGSDQKMDPASVPSMQTALANQGALLGQHDQDIRILAESVQSTQQQLSMVAAATSLIRLRQANRSAADYSVDFRILAADTTWNDDALRDLYFHSLDEQLQKELGSTHEAKSLKELISLSIKIDNRLRRYRTKGRSASVTTSPVYVRSSSQQISFPPVTPGAQLA
ncbi:hypothetical protein DNTS_026995, partial [Danionella cerebrum]